MNRLYIIDEQALYYKSAAEIHRGNRNIGVIWTLFLHSGIEYFLVYMQAGFTSFMACF